MTKEPQTVTYTFPRSARRGIIALAGVVLLASCSSGTESKDEPAPDTQGDLRPATLMLNWTPNAHHAGIYYAQEQGWYKDAGIDLSIIEPGADVGADVAVAENQVQFGISQAESLLPARASGMDVTAIATLLPVNDSALMGLRTSGLTEEPGSLEGLRYGGWGGSLETEIISELVQCGGGEPESVEFIDIGNVDYLAGLEQDRFDVVWVFGGWDALRAQSERDDVVLVQLSDHPECVPNWYTPILIANHAQLKQDPELAQDFLAVTSAGYEAVAADPAAGARALLEGAPELDETLVNDAVTYYAPKYADAAAGTGFGQMTDQVWQEFTEFLVQAGMLTDTTVLEGAWSNEYLPAS